MLEFLMMQKLRKITVNFNDIKEADYLVPLEIT